MFRNIIVGLDGSATAEQALPIAAGLARRAGARLRIIHALDYLHTDYPNCPEYADWWSDTTYDRAWRYVDQLAFDGIARWHIPIDRTVFEADALFALLRSPEAKAADLTVVTTHGHGPLERFWLGSIADHVIREAGSSVLVVPASHDRALRDDRPFKHMLVPLDGSETAKRVLHGAAHVVSTDACRITLVRVTHHAPVYALNYEAANADDESAADKYLSEQCEALKWMSDEVNCASLQGVSPIATQILDYAAMHDVDIIALSPHGHGGLHRLLLGSVADKIIRAARVPVLVVKNNAVMQLHSQDS